MDPGRLPAGNHNDSQSIIHSLQFPSKLSSGTRQAKSQPISGFRTAQRELPGPGGLQAAGWTGGGGRGGMRDGSGGGSPPCLWKTKGLWHSKATSPAHL